MLPLRQVEEVDGVPDPDGRHHEQAEHEERAGHLLLQHLAGLRPEVLKQNRSFSKYIINSL